MSRRRKRRPICRKPSASDRMARKPADFKRDGPAPELRAHPHSCYHLSREARYRKPGRATGPVGPSVFELIADAAVKGKPALVRINCFKAPLFRKN